MVVFGLLVTCSVFLTITYSLSTLCCLLWFDGLVLCLHGRLPMRAQSLTYPRSPGSPSPSHGDCTLGRLTHTQILVCILCYDLLVV